MIFISKSNPYFLFFSGLLTEFLTPLVLQRFRCFHLTLSSLPFSVTDHYFSLKQCIYFISLRAFCQVLLKNIFFISLTITALQISHLLLFYTAPQVPCEATL